MELWMTCEAQNGTIMHVCCICPTYVSRSMNGTILHNSHTRMLCIIIIIIVAEKGSYSSHMVRLGERHRTAGKHLTRALWLKVNDCSNTIRCVYAIWYGLIACVYTQFHGVCGAYSFCAHSIEIAYYYYSHQRCCVFAGIQWKFHHIQLGSVRLSGYMKYINKCTIRSLNRALDRAGMRRLFKMTNEQICCFHADSRT